MEISGTNLLGVCSHRLWYDSSLFFANWKQPLAKRRRYAASIELTQARRPEYGMGRNGLTLVIVYES